MHQRKAAHPLLNGRLSPLGEQKMSSPALLVSVVLKPILLTTKIRKQSDLKPYIYLDVCLGTLSQGSQRALGRTCDPRF